MLGSKTIGFWVPNAHLGVMGYILHASVETEPRYYPFRPRRLARQATSTNAISLLHDTTSPRYGYSYFTTLAVAMTVPPNVLLYCKY